MMTETNMQYIEYSISVQQLQVYWENPSSFHQKKAGASNIPLQLLYSNQMNQANESVKMKLIKLESPKRRMITLISICKPHVTTTYIRIRSWGCIQGGGSRCWNGNVNLKTNHPCIFVCLFAHSRIMLARKHGKTSYMSGQHGKHQHIYNIWVISYNVEQNTVIVHQ